jgi:hypothetical protein
MSSLKKKPADSAPIAASGGLQGPAPPADDPFQALDGLMSVIEALCPVWPQRPLLSSGGDMLL